MHRFCMRTIQCRKVMQSERNVKSSILNLRQVMHSRFPFLTIFGKPTMSCCHYQRVVILHSKHHRFQSCDIVRAFRILSFFASTQGILIVGMCQYEWKKCFQILSITLDNDIFFLRSTEKAINKFNLRQALKYPWNIFIRDSSTHFLSLNYNK